MSCGQRRGQAATCFPAAVSRSGPADGGVAAVHDLQPHAGRGGVLGRVPGEPASAGRGGSSCRRGVLGGVLEHRLDLGDVDDVDVQGPGAGRLGRLRAVPFRQPDQPVDRPHHHPRRVAVQQPPRVGPGGRAVAGGLGGGPPLPWTVTTLGSLGTGGTPMVTKYQKFADGYKAEAVKLYRESNQTIAETARNLGLKESTLANWVKKDKDNEAVAVGEAPLTPAERTRIRELEADVRRLNMENAFLKKGVPRAREAA